MATVIQTAQIAVPAGGQITFAFFGEFLYCKSANVAFKVQGHKTQNRFPMEAGAKVRITEQESQFLVINETASDLTAVLLFGSGDYENDQFNGTVTVTPGSNYQGLPKVTLTGGVDLLTNAGASRKELHLKAPVTNSGDVWLGGTVDEGLPLSPGDTLILEYSGSLQAIGTAADVVYLAEVLA